VASSARWASLDDKIVQRAVVTVLQAIHAADFRGFSYGFRTGRGRHYAFPERKPLPLRYRSNRASEVCGRAIDVATDDLRSSPITESRIEKRYLRA
jgi:hypothetical protein